MENNSNSQPVGVSKLNFKPKRIHLVFLSLVVLAVLLTVFLVVYSISQKGLPSSKTTPSPTSDSYEKELSTLRYKLIKKFENNQQIAKIGKETIYGADLNFIESVYFAKKAEAAKSDNEIKNLKKIVLEKIDEDSVLLQMAEKDGKTKLNSVVFDNLYKDQYERQKLVMELKKKYEEGQVSITGERISVWFQNTILRMPIDQAEKLAKEIIEPLYQEIKAGKLTFKQAGEKIISNPNTSKLDPTTYKFHAYMQFKSTNNQPVFTTEKLNKIIWELKEGEISGLIRVPTLGESIPKDGSGYYTVMKITKKTNEGALSLTEKLKKEKGTYKLVEL